MTVTDDLPKEYFDLKQLPLLHRRSIVPHSDLVQPTERQPADGRLKLEIVAPIDTKPTDVQKVHLANVQGDVCLKFPVKWERFLFFKIDNLSQFKKDLYKFAPRITSAAQTMRHLVQLHNKGSDEYDIVSCGIAFSRAGLGKMNVNEHLKDPHFDKGSMVIEKDELGDKGCYNRLFKTANNTHGVILLTAKLEETCKAGMNEIRALFKNSIEVLANWEGRVREGEAEHFGWRDGIAQPALIGIGEPIPGQRVVEPGVIIMGYPGDPVSDRPDFTKDGSFMVFRKLEQNVLYLEDYINANWKSIPEEIVKGTFLTEAERKALFGARLFGRFKSGVPLALSPYKEDLKYLQPKLINNFDYTEASNGCPFSAHVRKTEPRNLEPIVRKEFLDASVIIRSGIPYGPEISDEEREIWKTLTDAEKYYAKCNRGLFFVCYQSSLDNGFYRQTTGFANNDFFPITGLAIQKIGQDPIIGGPPSISGSTGTTDITRNGEVTLKLVNQNDELYEVTGVAKKASTGVDGFDQKFFATSRGGEYYFVPSISTVKSWGTPS